jgi:MYXO-CTERM domain-containing protein
MKPRNGVRNGVIVALLFVTTCREDVQKGSSPGIEQGKAALGVVTPSEVATWQKVGTPNSPGKRLLQAAAFDETRKVVVMFGGTKITWDSGNNATATANQETWEWDPATGKWTNRTTTETKPEARSGAAMVFDSARNKFVLFGGRATSGSNFQDTWEWDPTSGVWTKIDIFKNLPPLRAQHGMVFEKSTGKVLLFGGGRSSSTSSYLFGDMANGMALSLGDTWRYDPAGQIWSEVVSTTVPPPRHDFGMVWDSARNKAVLFGGLSLAKSGETAVGLQDTWEWDSANGTWTNRTSAGDKPSPRYAHAMAFDGKRKMAVVFGGWDATAGSLLCDLWDWNPASGAWARRLTGTETGMPTGHAYSSLVSDDGRARLELIAGATANEESGIGISGTREIWEFELTTPTYTERTPAYNIPSGRWTPAMGYNPSTGKVYLFGGMPMGSAKILNDTWQWDGQTWAQLITDVRPSPREQVSMAYDPVRKSMILFGGHWQGMVSSGDGQQYVQTTLGDTWELDATGKWTELKPKSSAEPLFNYGMATDTVRNKILLYAGAGMETTTGQPTKDYMRNTVWEWDGATLTWTDRSPLAASHYPTGAYPNTVVYDEGRQKMFLYDPSTADNGTSEFWEWDPVSAGWEIRGGADDFSNISGASFTLYDSIRRRVVLVAITNESTGKGPANTQTLELDTRGPTWYIRSLATSPKSGARITFDSQRGVPVLFGVGAGSAADGAEMDETWEYKVTNLGNGEGCNAAFVSSCASGFCVDGVCCDVAACTGTCKSCNVPGSEGTCAPVKAGTVVAGSCDGKACAADGSCLGKNGEACTAASACASGFCVDGVCCDDACTGTCVSCNQAGQVGSCRPYAAGTDPKNECSGGTGACKSTCDGVGSCIFPIKYMICGDCMNCDGKGECTVVDRQCAGLGGVGGSNPGGFGGKGPPPKDGTGGMTSKTGGAGGSIAGKGGAGGSTVGMGGAGGSSVTGGVGGTVANKGGSGGSTVGTGGSSGTSSPSSGGSSGNRDAGAPDAGKVGMKKSGCECAIGQAEQAGLPTPLLLAGLALLLVRKRRRKN